MRWEVMGADRQTGEDRTIVVDADSEAAAAIAANSSGLLVASVRRRQGKKSDIAPNPQTVPKPQSHCRNCGNVIGHLEAQHSWKGQPVCADCFIRLSGAVSPPVPVLSYAAPKPVSPPPQPSPPVLLGPNDIICSNPNCGYRGQGKLKSKGSALVMILLLILWILPGVLYAIIYNGDVLICPKCGVKIRDA